MTSLWNVLLLLRAVLFAYAAQLLASSTDLTTSSPAACRTLTLTAPSMWTDSRMKRFSTARFAALRHSTKMHPKVDHWAESSCDDWNTSTPRYSYFNLACYPY